jgi:hypothetical protein
VLPTSPWWQHRTVRNFWKKLQLFAHSRVTLTRFVPLLWPPLSSASRFGDDVSCGNPLLEVECIQICRGKLYVWSLMSWLAS